jgi:SEFIR domain
MSGNDIKVPKVFISYSQDSPEHNDRVRELSNRLINEGIHCYIDQSDESIANIQLVLDHAYFNEKRYRAS